MPPAVPNLDALTAQLVADYHADDRTVHLDAIFLPSRDKCIALVELLRKLTFPGFFEDQRLTSDNVQARTADLLQQIDALLYGQIRQTERYLLNQKGQAHAGDDCPECDVTAREKTDALLAAIPSVRKLLATDVQAAFDGDPAATHPDEAVFCYPGIDAIFIHRYAHQLYKLGLPLLARIFSEYAHNETGIDIHPGAEIGESLAPAAAKTGAA